MEANEDMLVAALIKALSKPIHEGLPEALCCIRGITMYARSVGNMAGLVRAGAIEAVASAAMSFRKSPSIIQMAIFFFVVALVEDRSLSARMIDLGLFDLVFEAKEGVDSPNFVHDILLLFIAIDSSQSTAKTFMERGGAEYIFWELQRYKSSSGQRPCTLILLLSGLIWNLENRLRIHKCGLVRLVIEYMFSHIDNEEVIANGAYFIGNVSINSIPIKADIGRAGGVRLVLDAMKRYSDKPGILTSCFTCLWNTTWGVSANKIMAAEYGSVKTITDCMMAYAEDVKIQKTGCGALDNILSLDVTHKRYCNDSVIKTLELAHARFPECEKISQVLLSLKRVLDPRVIDATSRGVCTKTMFPKCTDKDCGCDKNIYCPKCCTQQNVYKCVECDGEYSIKIYCEVCWKKFHYRHKCVKMFVSSRCCTSV